MWSGTAGNEQNANKLIMIISAAQLIMTAKTRIFFLMAKVVNNNFRCEYQWFTDRIAHSREFKNAYMNI